MHSDGIPPVLEMPAIWQVELTNHCPYHCLGCPRQFMTRSRGNMTFSIFEACISAVERFQRNVRPLGLHHFGESLLHPEIVRFVSFATARGVPTSLSCNPDRLSPDLSKGLIEAGLTRITFSLDGLDSRTLHKLRGPAADYHQAERGILDFLEARSLSRSSCEVRVQMIAYKSNQHQWEAFMMKWKSHDVFCHIKKFDSWTRPDLTSWGAEPMRVHCTFPYRFVVVLWDGRVVPCCHDYDGELVMGSINDGLGTVWNGEAYRAFRYQFHYRALPADHMCGRCAWWPGDEGGDVSVATH